MKLVTVATHSEYYYPWLVSSARTHSQDLITLGWGEKWQGFSHKFTLMLNFLQSISHDEIVCFVDGYDVLVLKPLHDMEQKARHILNNTNFKIITALDIHKNPFYNMFSPIFFSKCQKKPLNSGTYMGRAKDLYNILHHICTHNVIDSNSDDQLLLTQYCSLHPDSFFIDTKSQFFLTIVDPFRSVLNHVSIQNNTVSYNNSQPFIIHGAGLTDMDSLLLSLNYNLSQDDLISLQNYRFNAFLKKTFIYLPRIFCSSNFILFSIFVIYVIYLVKKNKSL